MNPHPSLHEGRSGHGPARLGRCGLLNPALEAELTAGARASGTVRPSSSRAWRALATAIVLGASLGLAACASSSNVLVGQARTATTPAQVKLYLQAPKRYQQIALIEANSRLSFSFSDQAKMDSVVARMKEQAAQVGANGLLLQQTGAQPGSGLSIGLGGGSGGLGGGIGTSTASMDRTGSGIAIWVEEE